MARKIKERTALPLAERHVSMSNALARTAQGLTLAEKRMIALGMVKTDSVSGGDAVLAQRAGGWVVKLLAGEYAEEFAVSLDTAYDQLKSGTDHLFKREAQMVEQTHKGPKITRINWIGKAVYHEGEGWIELHFTTHISPHLLALRGSFCTYKLKQAATLRSIYAWRLFECLQSWKGTGLWRVDIEEFMHAMDAPASCRKDFGRLRKRVIEPAVKEIAIRGDMEIEWDTVKAGRKVSGLAFKFKPKQQQELPL